MRRAGDLGIANEADRGVDSVRGGEPQRSAPAAGQAGHRRAAGQAERDPDQNRADRGEQQAASDPSGRLEVEACAARRWR